MIITEFDDFIAERLRAEHRSLAARWLDRLLALLPVEARDVFPSDSLLDHIPALILEIGGYLRHPEDQAIAANTTIIAKANELGALRHEQQASLHQVVREHQILGSILATFVAEEIDRLALHPPAADSIRLVARLNEAVNALSQATVERFVSLYTQTIADQAERLEQFTRMVTHEWRQPLDAVQFGVSLLRRADLQPDRRDRTLETVERNVHRLIELTWKVETVARMHAEDTPVMQDVSLVTVAEEVARQLREMADARGVNIRIASELPRLVVDVGRLELTLLNLLSNAIKYSDAQKPVRYVQIDAGPAADGWCRLLIADNGVGISRSALTTAFRTFTRAHADREDLAEVGGLGLGLAIVDDCVRAMRGRIEIESVEGEGTTVSVELPLA